MKVTETNDIFNDLSKVGFYKELYTFRVMLEIDDNWWIKLGRTKKFTSILSFFKKVTFATQI